MGRELPEPHPAALGRGNADPAFDRLETRIRALEAQVRELGGDPGEFEIPA